MSLLLDRNTFRESVFLRDGHKCVICGNDGQDAHHILERRLFSDGGYYLDNGATLCGECHLKAESTEISCEQIREKIGVSTPILPDHLYRDNVYDKWGNIILPNGQRLPGELFNDESVQKILKIYLNINSVFSPYIKYPRTYHLPWSEGLTKDDRVHPDVTFFDNKDVVITIKMDGENSSIYNDYFHARSVNGQPHWSQSYVKNLQGKIGWQLPAGWRICGENLYAKHSIKYYDLEDFLLMFSIWDENNMCLSWDETVEWSKLLDIKMVPVLYYGKFNADICHSLWNQIKNKHEGYVVRLASKFSYGEFKKSVAKFVRKEHVNTAHHWKYTATEKNELQN